MKIKEKSFNNFTWIDIENPTMPELHELQNRLNIDANYLEDALETGHLPKIEKTDHVTFIILRAYTAQENEKVIEVGQISSKIAFFIYKDELITIHRAAFAFLNRYLNEEVKRYASIDNLVLSLFNDVLLTYQNPIQNQSEKIDFIEQQIFLQKPTNLSIENLYFEKSKARLTKKILIITQHVINEVHLSNKLDSHIQDLKDTIIDLVLRIEEVLEDAMSLLNTYLSLAAQKNNDVMKLLTIFSAFFLPLTFIVGIYGMNFKNMPGLYGEYGFYMIIAVMVVIAVLIYLWFKRKKIM